MRGKTSPFKGLENWYFGWGEKLCSSSGEGNAEALCLDGVKSCVVLLVRGSMYSDNLHVVNKGILYQDNAAFRPTERSEDRFQLLGSEQAVLISSTKQAVLISWIQQTVLIG